MCISGIATDSSEAVLKKSQKDLNSEALMTFLIERKPKKSFMSEGDRRD